MAITPQKRRFAAEYLIELGKTKPSGTQAAIRAGYSKKTAHSQASRLLKDVEVMALIDQRRQAAVAVVQKQTASIEMTAENLVARVWSIATADGRELSEIRRVCCRFCYGKGHLYQEKPSERHARQMKWDAILAQTPMQKWQELGQFNELGGVGYDTRKPPLEECPECNGLGTELVLFKDTSQLSDQAQHLFAGVKITANGMEVKAHDQMKAIEMMGRYFKVFGDADRGDPNEPRKILLINDPDDLG